MRLKSILKRKGYTSIKLRSMATKHLEIKAMINGVKGRFILDTGASSSCVGFEGIDKFNLEVEDTDTKAAGAGAVDMDTKLSPKNSIKIKDWRYHSLPLVVFDLTHVNTALKQQSEHPIDGILGADILEKGKGIIDYKKKRLYLKKLVYKF
ncbi:MAG: clan AA aspartic protease [Flavobacteriaceae bacterium]|nr:clan AA aspartic protease [Flavobacteriaceae bacterium]